jgi:hypothetical protein
MTRDELNTVLAELDLPFHERQQRRQETEKQAEAEQSRRLTDAEAARLRAYIDQRLAEHHDYLHELLPEPIASFSPHPTRFNNDNVLSVRMASLAPAMGQH